MPAARIPPAPVPVDDANAHARQYERGLYFRALVANTLHLHANRMRVLVPSQAYDTERVVHVTSLARVKVGRWYVQRSSTTRGIMVAAVLGLTRGPAAAAEPARVFARIDTAQHDGTQSASWTPLVDAEVQPTSLSVLGISDQTHRQASRRIRGQPAVVVWQPSIGASVGINMRVDLWLRVLDEFSRVQPMSVLIIEQPFSFAP